MTLTEPPGETTHLTGAAMAKAAGVGHRKADARRAATAGVQIRNATLQDALSLRRLTFNDTSLKIRLGAAVDHQRIHSAIHVSNPLMPPNNIPGE